MAKDKDEVKQTVVVGLDPIALAKLREQEENEAKGPGVVFSILDELQKNQHQYNFLGRDKDDKQFRLAFEADPATQSGIYESLYRSKAWLLPDSLIKKIHRSDDLVAAVLNTRGNHIGAHGRPRENRFDLGFDIIVDKKYTEGKSEKELEELMVRVDAVKKQFFNCGSEVGWDYQEKLNLSEFLKMFTVDGLRFGRAAVEIIYQKKDPDKFHSFRPVDAGTIYKIAPFAKKRSAESLRQQSKKLLERLKGLKLPKEHFDPKKWEEDEYAWVQVIDSIPRQAFRSDQMVVHNFYPTTDVEYAGYPLTPMDTIINAVTTHMNISQHNKLYFQSGRATRGMLVISSDSIDEGAIQKIRLQFNASINSVQNAHRMPVFGIGSEDNLVWQPLDQGGNRDKEFANLADGNARTILAAFQMSPDELPGYAHLSRASNQQSLSESNNEFKLEAARDVGLRPLLMTVQDFLNNRIFPLLDPELSKIACVALQGLDADDPIKETEKFEAGMRTHYSYNDIMDAVDKKKIEKSWGGDFPLNPQFQVVLDKYFTVGELKAEFFDDPEAVNDPSLAYYRDPIWMQWQQILVQRQQMEMQMQQQQEQMQMQQEQNTHQQDMDQRGQDREDVNATTAQEEEALQQGGGDVSSSIDQIIGALSKSERQLAPSKRRLLAQHRATVNKMINHWELESEEFLRDIIKEAAKFTNKRGRSKKGGK